MMTASKTVKAAAKAITDLRAALKGATPTEREAIVASLRGLIGDAPKAEVKPAEPAAKAPTAAEVKVAAAESVRAGEGFGDDKAFVSDVHARVAGAMPLDAFKALLLSMHRAGELSLNRGDLVEAMDQSKVDASEIAYLSAQYHFVRVG